MMSDRLSSRIPPPFGKPGSVSISTAVWSYPFCLEGKFVKRKTNHSMKNKEEYNLKVQIKPIFFKQSALEWETDSSKRGFVFLGISCPPCASYLILTEINSSPECWRCPCPANFFGTYSLGKEKRFACLINIPVCIPCGHTSAQN